jgi:hypothetical protein
MHERCGGVFGPLAQHHAPPWPTGDFAMSTSVLCYFDKRGERGSSRLQRIIVQIAIINQEA